jgi:hypothetical protein
LRGNCIHEGKDIKTAKAETIVVRSDMAFTTSLDQTAQLI